jgi:ABC-2 type transport system permease protein
MNWSQLKTVLWLRWRLTRNQLFRGSSIGGVLLVILGVLCVGLVVTICAGTTFAGFFALRQAKPELLLMIWTGAALAFLFIWLLGLLVELQRSEAIDLQRLMHLPVRLGQVFVINYLASHAVFSIVMLVPGMVGLALGLTFGRSWMFILLLPLLACFIFMITAWTYCLRGWLATLMSNPRRRRTVIMCLTIGFVLLGQGPNLYFNVIRRSPHPPANESAEARTARKAAEEAKMKEVWSKVVAAQKFIPPLWLPLGAKGIAEGNPLPALLGTLGCFGLGALGLHRAYRSTVRFYHGDTGKKSTAIRPQSETAPAPVSKPRHSKLLELRLPGVPEPAAVVAGATMRSMLRAPEVKIAFGTSFLVVIVLGAMVLVKSAPKLPEVGKPFAIAGAAAFILFMLFQFISNQFGLDRDGFRVLVLSPVDRRHLLLGKNLAIIPAVALSGLLVMVILTLWLHIPPIAAFAGLLQLATMTLLLITFGNLLSILLPFRIQAGTMKPTKPPFLKMLALVFCQFAVPLILAPAMIPPLAELLWRSADGPALVPVNLILSVVLAALAVTGYWLLLQPLANLYSRREMEILKSVTIEGE